MRCKRRGCLNELTYKDMEMGYQHCSPACFEADDDDDGEGGRDTNLPDLDGLGRSTPLDDDEEDWVLDQMLEDQELTDLTGDDDG